MPVGWEEDEDPYVVPDALSDAAGALEELDAAGAEEERGAPELAQALSAATSRTGISLRIDVYKRQSVQGRQRAQLLLRNHLGGRQMCIRDRVVGVPGSGEY